MADRWRCGWGPACSALKDRDRWISWSAKGSWPNLASQALGAALRARPGQWRQQFGCRPLLDMTFTDPEAYAGTCDRAGNWIPVGFSAGYSRHRADFYVPNHRPKKLWLYPLAADARGLSRAPQLPPEYRAGLVAPPLTPSRGGRTFPLHAA